MSREIRNHSVYQYIGAACHALTQGDYTHLHNQVANIIHQELATKWDYQIEN